MNLGRILVVDDEVAILDALVFGLQEAGYQVCAARSVREAEAQMQQSHPDLIVLDVMLPDESGLEFCRRLGHSPHIPIIFLSARGELEDRVEGLRAGADDYLVKPFELIELLARVQAVLRRWHNPGEIFRYRDMELHSAHRRLIYRGQILSLTPLEHRLLEKLLSQPGSVFSRSELLSTVWGVNVALETNCLEVTISGLRAKLGDLDRTVIRTVRGLGYRIGDPD